MIVLELALLNLPTDWRLTHQLHEIHVDNEIVPRAKLINLRYVSYLRAVFPSGWGEDTENDCALSFVTEPLTESVEAVLEILVFIGINLYHILVSNASLNRLIYIVVLVGQLP